MDFFFTFEGIPSDLDSAQPHSYTEEQLQLQLALAISKEEHERELQKRHEEEAKEALKLQMVLEQSKRDEQVRSGDPLSSIFCASFTPISWVGSTPRSPVPVPLHLLALKLSPSLLTRFERSSHPSPFWF